MNEKCNNSGQGTTGQGNGFLFIIVLYILLAIILSGSFYY